jgi:hypothetical protein
MRLPGEEQQWLRAIYARTHICRYKENKSQRLEVCTVTLTTHFPRYPTHKAEQGNASLSAARRFWAVTMVVETPGETTAHKGCLSWV